MNTNIKVIDVSDIGDPQVLAMLQAFYSRSPMPIEERLATLSSDGEGSAEEKIRNAIKRYYVDYGHASIGECGTATVFIENVSMLAAKAIQDHPLYVGQECSTRYIDFARQPFKSTTIQSSVVNEVWRELYLKALPLAKEYAKRNFRAKDVLSAKIPPEKVDEAFDKTCQAIAFDYCRGILPAGATTSLAWTANFRVFNDHLHFLVEHPLEEVRVLAKTIYRDLSKRYGSSFKQKELEEHNPRPYDMLFYPAVMNGMPTSPQVTDTWRPDNGAWGGGSHGLRLNRDYTDQDIFFQIRGPLDFGSYRDLQRHRRGTNRMPKLTETGYGFHRYYEDAYEEMSPELADLIGHQMDEVCKQQLTNTDLQYLLPMGLQVATDLIWDFGQLRYVMALRTKTSVHPTLRSYMNNVYESAIVRLDEAGMLGTHAPLLQRDTSPDYFASDRGEQTIKEKQDGSGH